MYNAVYISEKVLKCLQEWEEGQVYHLHPSDLLSLTSSQNQQKDHWSVLLHNVSLSAVFNRQWTKMAPESTLQQLIIRT